MPCPKEEALLKLFNNVFSSFQLLFLLLFSCAIFLVTFLTFTGRFPLIQSDQQYEYVFSEDDEEEEEEETQEEYSCVDSTEKEHVKCGSKETLLFLHKEEHQRTHSYSEEFITPRESLVEDSEENHYSETLSIHNSPLVSDFENEEAEAVDEDFPSRDADSFINLNLYKSYKNSDGDHVGHGIIKNKKMKEASLRRDERLFVFASSQMKSKKLMVDDENNDDDDDDDDDDDSMCSSEWRSSIHYSRDSETEDAFSTSSRRSCPKWESYTLFQKNEEDKAFLDRINAQKRNETESLRSIQMSPRSLSERIVNKFPSINKKPVDVSHNPYHELEAAYVAQICLTWEALSWNYKSFRSKHSSQSRHDLDTGCPAAIAQQFQQFQVLLQRYIENEPYEHGRRPEIYARMRLLAPKLLLVPNPEYPDAEEEQKDNDFDSKISSATFLKIMEYGIRTFMNFLNTDKEKPCQILADYFKRNRRGMVDSTLLRLMKKVNQKKRVKVKNLRRSGKGLRKRRLKVEEEMENLMALIDLKVVSRVLRMNELSEQQLHWCEEKMSKVKVVEGRIQRDYSTPLFFPSHCNIW